MATSIDAILPFDAESTHVTSRNNKLDSALDTSKKLWQAVADLDECKDMREIFELTLCASARIQSIECSSSSYGRKYNSFLGGLEQVLQTEVTKVTIMLKHQL
jgi:hypothetical protein